MVDQRWQKLLRAVACPVHHDHPAVPQGISRGRMTTGYLRSRQIDGDRGRQAVGHRRCPTEIPLLVATTDSSDVTGRHRAHDFNGGNLRYVARADGVTDSIVVIIIAAIYVIIVILRHGGRAAVVTDLIQIAHAHGGSDARWHRRHIICNRGNHECPGTDVALSGRRRTARKSRWNLLLTCGFLYTFPFRSKTPDSLSTRLA